MHFINVTQFKDDDDDIITTAATDPPAMSVSVRTTGEIVDVGAQAAFVHRYDPLPEM